MNSCVQCGKPETEEGYQSHNCFQYLKARNKELEEALAVAAEEKETPYLQIDILK